MKAAICANFGLGCGYPGSDVAHWHRHASRAPPANSEGFLGELEETLMMELPTGRLGRHATPPGPYGQPGPRTTQLGGPGSQLRWGRWRPVHVQAAAAAMSQRLRTRTTVPLALLSDGGNLKPTGGPSPETHSTSVRWLGARVVRVHCHFLAYISAPRTMGRLCYTGPGST